MISLDVGGFYLFKDKSETFVNWKVKVENQIGENVKYLRTDSNAEIDHLSNLSGITRYRIVPYAS